MRAIKIYLFVVAIFLSFITIVYAVYLKGYKRFYSFEHGRLKEIFNGSTYYDVLFVGSSRTYNAINPKVIDSVTGLNSYNAGASAASLVEMNMYLQGYLKSHKPPKLVVADLAKTAFDVTNKATFHPNLYYPFLHNDIVFNTLTQYQKNLGVLKYVSFTRLMMANDILKQNAFLGYFGFKSVDSTETYKGYKKRGADTISLPFKRFYPLEIENVTKEGISLLMQIVETCKVNGITLVFTYAPVYKLTDEKNPAFFPTIQNICAQYNIPFLNYRENDIGNRHELFSEELHVNNIGADIYSKMVGRDLKSL